MPKEIYESCPLCLVAISEPKGAMESHIADHLVSLALDSLPSYHDDTAAGEVADGDTSSPTAMSSPTLVEGAETPMSAG